MAVTTTTMASGSKGKRSRSSEAEPPPPAPVWKVVRLAAKDRESRKKEGGDLKCKQKKTSCESLEILKDGVQGTARGLFNRKYTIQDYNHYRMQGHSGRFEAGTRNRAVSIATVSAYKWLQKELDPSGKIKVERGDFGENILIDGPPVTATETKQDGQGLFVGAKVRVGSALLELTEANNPCFRFNTQVWAPQAKNVWGKSAPGGTVSKWFKSKRCPLNHEVNPGVRGWLAKVIEEGEVTKGDEVQLVLEEEEEEKATKDNSDEDAAPSSKKRKTEK